MVLPSSKNRFDCFYCQDIQKEEKNYPLRRGKYSNEGLVSRCLWHSKFQCLKCHGYFHFSFLYWCPTTNKIVCGKCNKPSFYPVKFWNKTYAYAFYCKDCGKIHFDLLYSEFMGQHPWQIDKQTLFKKESPLIPIINIRFPWEPIWKPIELRKGVEITIQEALKVENRAHSLIKDYDSITLHSEVLKEEQIELLETRTRWEKTSQNWLKDQIDTKEDLGDDSRKYIIDPALWKQLSDVKGLKVLDAGCGNGYLSRQLAEKGAKVVGVDFSKHFIAFCKKREKEKKLGCEYHCGSLTNMPFLESATFDLVVSNVVMVDVQDYISAFSEINRLLKPKGRFVWSNLHPIFGSINQIFYRLPYDTPRNEEKLFSIVDRYFDSGAILMSWGKIKPIWQFHRTLQEYTQALNKTGFLIKEIIEPKPSLEDIKQNPKMLAFDNDRIPFFIIYDCIKAI